MSDLISLRCENCGGKLIISANTRTVICESCNSEYLVKRDSGTIELETFAACPICQKNDKSRKLSTIRNRFPSPVKPLYKGERWSGFLKFYGWVGLFFAVLASVNFFLDDFGGNKFSDIFFFSSFLLLAGFVLLKIGNSIKNTDTDNENEFNKAELPKWKEKMDHWEKLYYCERDDIVFDISTRKYCDPENISEKLLN